MYRFVLLIALLILVAGDGSIVRADVAHAAHSDGARETGPQIGDPVELTSPTENRRLKTTVTQFADPFETSQSTPRGSRVVGVHIEIENPGTLPFALGQEPFWLLDDAGIPAANVVWRYSSDALAGRQPFLTDQLDPGQAASGWLVFELSTAARAVSLVYFGNDAPPLFTLVAWLDPFAPSPHNGVPILDFSGNPIGTFSIEFIVTHFERTDAGIDPFDWTTTVGVIVTLTNTGDETWELPDDYFWVTDQFGMIYGRSVYDRSMHSYQNLPDLRFRAEPQETVQGVLMFEMPQSSKLTNFLYANGEGQIYVMDAIRPEITISGADALELVEIKTRVSHDVKCAGIGIWAEESMISMQVAAQAVENATGESGSVSSSGLRSAAESLRLVYRDQSALVVPELARQAQDDVLAVLDAAIIAFEAAADSIDAGESAESVVSTLESPRSPITLAANTAVRSIVTVLVDCPA